MKYLLIAMIYQLFMLLNSCAFSSLGKEKTRPGQTVNLSRRGLTAIPEEILNDSTIRILKLYGNSIDSIPPSIRNMKNLEELYIGKNNLKEFPEEIGELKKLKLLSAQYNEISILPESIGNLENLEQLILNQNRLLKLPGTIGNLKKLENLRLSYNELQELPPDIGRCENLRFLYLNRNFLKTLPVEMSNLHNLKELCLYQAGLLLSVPEEFCEMRYLEILEIDENTAIPPCLLVRQTSRLKIIRY